MYIKSAYLVALEFTGIAGMHYSNAYMISDSLYRTALACCSEILIHDLTNIH